MILESHMLKDPISFLHIKYTDDQLDQLSYEDIHNKILVHSAGMKLSNNTMANYWEVEYNNAFSSLKIAANYITMDNIRRLSCNKRSIKIVTFETALESSVETNSFAIHLTRIPGKDIALVFESNYSVAIEENEYCTIVKVKNLLTNKFEETHYIDEHIYVVNNLLENSESVYIKESNIKYDFKMEGLSISNYLQYHQPYRVTNYSTDKQYIMEYDDHGIMKSMIYISDPEFNLCTYIINTIEDSKMVEIQSIHPDIYDAFDKHHLDPNFLESGITVLESYVSFFPIQASSYKRYTSHIEDIVVD